MTATSCTLKCMCIEQVVMYSRGVYVSVVPALLIHPLVSSDIDFSNGRCLPGRLVEELKDKSGLSLEAEDVYMATR